MVITPRSVVSGALRFGAESPLNWYSDPSGVIVALQRQLHQRGPNIWFSLADLFEKMSEELHSASPERQQRPGQVFHEVLQGRLHFPPDEAEKILEKLARFQLIAYDANHFEACKITEAGREAYGRLLEEEGILDTSSLDNVQNWQAGLGGTTPEQAAAGIAGKAQYLASQGYTGPGSEQITPKQPTTAQEQGVHQQGRLTWESLGGQSVEDALKETKLEPSVPAPDMTKAIAIYERKKLAVDPRLEPYGEFIKDLSHAESHGRNGSVVGREKDIQKLTRVMNGCLSKKAVLYGPSQSGKTSIIRGMASNMSNARIWSVDLSGVVSGTKYRGQMEEKFRNFLEFASTQPDLILHIPRADKLVNGGGSEDGINLSTIFAPYLDDPNLRVVLEMSDTGYRRTFEKDDNLQSQFRPIPVKESPSEELLQIVQSFCPKLEAHYNLQPISRALLSDTIRLVRENIRNKPFIPVMKDVLDAAGTAAQGGKMTMAHVAEALGDVAGGIPLARLTETDKESLTRLEETLSNRVIGHSDAKKRIAQAIRHRRSGLFPKKGPVGVFMLDGPTGVGKTELAKAVAEWLSGKPGSEEENLIRINFNEMGKGIGATRVGGAPPGYVGYEQGGQLTEQIIKKPNSVILLDEIEKADEDTRHLLLTLMDEGIATDGQGRTIDARNCVIIMTTNAGARDREKFDKSSAEGSPFGFHNKSAETLAEERRIERQEIMEEALEQHFSPEFRNRINDILILDDLSEQEQTDVINLHLDKLVAHLKKQNFHVDVDPEVRKFLVGQLFSESSHKAGRKVKDILTKQLEIPLSEYKIANDLNDAARLKVRMNEKKTAVVISPDTRFDLVG